MGTPLHKVIRAVERSRSPVQLLEAGAIQRGIHVKYPPLRGPATHASYEIVVCFAGRLMLAGANRSIVLNPGEVAVIEPGAWHYETCTDKRQSYKACWIVALGMQRRSNVSSYDGRQFESHVLRGIVSGRDCDEFYRNLIRQIRGRRPRWKSRTREMVIDLLRDFQLNVRDISQPPAEIEVEPVRQLVRIVENRFRDPLEIRELARELGFSPNYLSSLFKQTFHTTFTNYLNMVRVWHALFLLEYGVPPKEVALETGFKTVQYFTTVFAQKYRMSPGKYQKTCLARKDFPPIPRKPSLDDVAAFGQHPLLQSVQPLRP